MNKKIEKITVSGEANVWPHERRTVQALARAGYDVEFVKKSDQEYAVSADIIIDGELWEMKAPKASNARAIDRNVRKALHQAENIVFDSRRMKEIPDKAIERELRKHARDMRSIKKMLFVNSHGDVIDIK